MKRERYKILKETTGVTFNLPIYLESTADEMGVMVGFDGDIEEVEQLCNFSYTQSGSTITVYNTVNPDKLRKIIEQTYDIEWGDGTSGSTISVVTGNLLPSVSHTYSTNGNFTITISLLSPWSHTKLSKIITTPQDLTVSNPLGTFTHVDMPIDLDYLNDIEYVEHDSDAVIYFVGIGSSRKSELKKYGVDEYIGVTTGVDEDGLTFSEYVIDDLTYRDYESGYTTISGNTSDFNKEEVFNKMITRNEHLLGFVDDPTIYSDIFVERGKQGVMEVNLRLGEIDNMGELEIYGNGFFNVRKQ